MPSTQRTFPAAELWGAPDERDFVAPSGGRCKIRDLQLDDLVAMRMLDMMDSLGDLVQTEHIDRTQGRKPSDRKPKKLTKAQEQAKQEKDVKSLMADPKRFTSVSMLIDKVAAVCVLEPVLENPYIDVDPNDLSKGERKRTRDERLDGAIYSDQVPFNDRLAIFNEVFKNFDGSGLEQFREGSGKDAANVADESGSESDSE